MIPGLVSGLDKWLEESVSQIVRYTVFMQPCF
jgi:hypothetical protein